MGQKGPGTRIAVGMQDLYLDEKNEKNTRILLTSSGGVSFNPRASASLQFFQVVDRFKVAVIARHEGLDLKV